MYELLCEHRLLLFNTGLEQANTTWHEVAKLDWGKFSD